MNNWNLEGMRVEGTYLGKFPVKGVVSLSRVKYGGSVSHHVVLDTPLSVYGTTRDVVILDHSDVEEMRDNN